MFITTKLQLFTIQHNDNDKIITTVHQIKI